MQLYINNNNIIINAAEHKGTIEEKHVHIETPGLVKDQGKTHYGENPCKPYSNIFSSNHSLKESTMIHIFTTTRISMKCI